MSSLNVRLFGKFEVQCGEQDLAGLDAPKVQELFSYLLLYRGRAHPRETLSSLLWPDVPTSDSRKCLRQVLWRLQTALETQTGPINGSFLLLEPNWIQLDPETDLWIDVAAFEQAFILVHRMAGQQLQASDVQAVQTATQLYRGDLLEGCYQDWCLFERERLQSMYLSMLEKLMAYYEAHGEYETGLACGSRVLRCDAAHERTHRRLMRLHYLLGNRTAALRQYERCVVALREALNVHPSERTVAIYEQIRSDQLVSRAVSEAIENHRATALPLLQMLSHLKMFQTTLVETQRQLQQAIQVVEMALNRSN